MRIARIRSGAKATLEGLREAKEAMVRTAGVPDYVLVKVELGRYLSDQKRVDRLLRELCGGESAVPVESPSNEVVLIGNRSMLLSRSTTKEHSEDGDPDEELLLYMAFVSQTLVHFSQRVSELVLPRKGTTKALSAESLFRDFVRFQAAYYQVEVARTSRGRLLAEQLRESLNVREHYSEVRAEMQQLTHLEEQLAEERRAGADTWLQIFLYLTAISGVLQTLAALWSLESRAWFTGFAQLAGGALLFLLLPIPIWLLLRRRAPRRYRRDGPIAEGKRKKR